MSQLFRSWKSNICRFIVEKNHKVVSISLTAADIAITIVSIFRTNFHIGVHVKQQISDVLFVCFLATRLEKLESFCRGCTI